MTICARKIVFCADEDLCIVLRAADFGPLRPWIGIANVLLVNDPGPRQGIVDYRHFVMQDVWIRLVQVDSLFEDGLIVEVQRKAGEVVNARPFEWPSRLDFENVVAAVTVFVDPSAD